MKRLLDFVKEHKVQSLLVIWGVLLAIAIIIAVVLGLGSTNKAPDGSAVIDEVDPTSQQPVQVDGSYSSNGESDPIANGPQYVGWDYLTGSNQAQWSQTIKRMINLYAYENNITLWRISIFKDSLSQSYDQEPYGALTTTSKFRVMLNRDEKGLAAEVIDNGDTKALSIKLFDTNGNLIWEKSTIMSTTTTEYYTDNIPAGLVKLKRRQADASIEARFLSANDRVWDMAFIGGEGFKASIGLAPGFDPPKPETNAPIRVYLACPTDNNVSDYSQCQIYKYEQ
jgi:hypothetical protein